MNAKERINRVTVQIANEEYVVKGNAEARHIEKVASYVDAKMKQIAMANPMLPPAKVAVLTALNLADEYFRLKEDYGAFIKLLEEDKGNLFAKERGRSGK